jgi:hypothetical protein
VVVSTVTSLVSTAMNRRTAMMRRCGRVVGGLALALGLTACSSSAKSTPASTSTSSGASTVTASCPLPTFGPGKDYHPVIDASTFTAIVDNPWFPLKPGTTLVYAGTKDGKAAMDVVTVSARTKTIDGVETRVVEDRLFLDNVLEERTSDYYSQDACGNVWYFGEDTATLDEQGKVVERSGSFRAGVKGAQPGVFMQAQPELNRWFRQEWSVGEAEDQFRAVDLSSSVKVPFGMFRHSLRTEEQTALEPDVLDNKQYVRGIGEVLEVAVKGPVEKLELVDVLS